ncbi:MAG: methionyl-tRNA formyltransferase [Devosiaceae bacterium]|nr:methionyl-tRNA formyltransferase [Devosiaceae bacterium]
MALRIIFMGTPDFAANSLSEIIKSEHDVVAVYSQPARPAGRNKKLQKSAVQQLAEQSNIQTLTPLNFKQNEDIEQFIALKADVAIIVAYGLLLPKIILDAPKYGCLNLHGSLLPRWRGAAPIQRAIMAGDKKTGLMVMQMDEGLDTGSVALSKVIKIKKNMLAGELHDEMKIVGAKLLIKALNRLEKNKLEFLEQSKNGITYAKKIKKSESKINWQLNAKQIINNIRGLSPFPGAWFEFDIKDKPTSKLVRVKILSAIKVKLPKDIKAKPGEVLDNDFTIACGKNAIRPILLQRAGKGVMGVDEFLRGMDKSNLLVLK